LCRAAQAYPIAARGALIRAGPEQAVQRRVEGGLPLM